MPAVLVKNSYGKSRIRLTKVTRRPDRHDVRELTIDIVLEGDFADAYTLGDNRLLIATDTMKNVASPAKEHPLDSIEGFGLELSDHFLANHAARRSRGRAAFPSSRSSGLKSTAARIPTPSRGRTASDGRAGSAGRGRAGGRGGTRRPVPPQGDRLVVLGLPP